MGDLAARMGGEEFVILLECDKIADAAAIAERLRLLVARLKRGCPADSASASFGVSWTRPAERSLDELLSEADRPLYVAKVTGRNRVVVQGAAPAQAMPVAPPAPDTN